jgi:hypothetical protein
MTPPAKRALPPKQQPPRVLREVLAKVTKADDLEVHACKARIDGVVVLDIRDYIPSTKTYGRGTSLPWNTESLKVLRSAMAQALKEAGLDGD